MNRLKTLKRLGQSVGITYSATPLIERQLHEIETLQAKYEIGDKLKTKLSKMLTRKKNLNEEEADGTTSRNDVQAAEKSRDSVRTEINEDGTEITKDSKSDAGTIMKRSSTTMKSGANFTLQQNDAIKKEERKREQQEKKEYLTTIRQI